MTVSISDVVQRRFGLMLIALLLVLFIWQQVGMFTGQPYFPVDDSYITLQNALELLGKQSAFGGQGELTGATSLAHTALVALLAFLTQNDLWALSLAALLGAWLYLMGVAELASYYSKNPLTLLATMLVGAFFSLVPHQLSNGLETSWAMAAVVWSLCLYLRETQRANRWLCILLGAQIFVRPELLALSGLLGLLLIYRQWQQSQDLGATGSFALQAIGFGLLGMLPFLLLNLFVTGTLVPNTISAKRYFFAEGCRSLNWKTEVLINASRWLISPWPVFMLGFAGLSITALGRMGILFALVFYYFYFKYFPGALGHYEGRYQYILVPFVLLGLLTLYSRLNSFRWNQLGPGVAVLISCIVLAFCFTNAMQTAKNNRGFTQHRLEPVADWLNENVAEGQTVLVHDAGYVGYAIDGAVLADLVGLKTPAAIEVHRDYTSGTCGAQRNVSFMHIYRLTAPQYVVVLTGWDTVFGISDAINAAGARLQKRFELENGYTVYEVTGD